MNKTEKELLKAVLNHGSVFVNYSNTYGQMRERIAQQLVDDGLCRMTDFLSEENGRRSYRLVAATDRPNRKINEPGSVN